MFHEITASLSARQAIETMTAVGPSANHGAAWEMIAWHAAQASWVSIAVLMLVQVALHIHKDYLAFVRTTEHRECEVQLTSIVNSLHSVQAALPLHGKGT